MASLHKIQEEMRVAGATVWPMSGLDDVARLFLAAASCARGAFDLAERVAARFADKLLEVALLRSLPCAPCALHSGEGVTPGDKQP